jgi:hypothetical protein
MMNLPEDFIRETRQLMGEERFNRYLGAFEEEAPVSIRLNLHKGTGTLCTVQTPLQPGSVAIVKIGDKSVKVVVR